MKKKSIIMLFVFSLTLSFAMLLACISAFADSDIVASGECGVTGENVIWSLDNDGILTIQGEGVMDGYSNSSEAPWYPYRSKIKYIFISNGVTDIGSYCFADCTNLENVSLPNGLRYINNFAFQNCSSLKGISLPQSMTGMGSVIFRYCSSLKYIGIWDKFSYDFLYSSTFTGVPRSAEIVTINPSGAYKFLTELGFNNIHAFTPTIIETTPEEGFDLRYNSICIDKESSVEADTFLFLYGEITAKDLVFSEYDDSIITCNNGTITAKGIGSTQLKISNGTISKNITVFVNDSSTSSSKVSFPNQETIMYVGETKGFPINVTPENSSATDVTWKSSNTKILTVNNGVVTAKALGTATITVTSGNSTAQCKVTVYNRLEKIQISSYETRDMNRGEKRHILYYDCPTNHNDNSVVVYESSDEKVISISDQGEMTAVGIGKATITVRKGSYSDSATIQVFAPLKGISFEQPEEDLLLYSTKKLNVIFNPEDTTDSKDTIWSSDNPSIVSVDNDGSITAHKLGKAVITATVGKHTATCSITVTEKHITEVNVAPSNETLLKGQYINLVASWIPIDTTDDTSVVTWTSENPEIAVVDDHGKVTAKKEGIATITATVAGVIGKSTIVCEEKHINYLTIDTTEKNLFGGETLQLNASWGPEDTTDEVIIEWESSDENVASVDNNGLVTAKDEGTATIKASFGNLSTSCVINVERISLESATVSPIENQIYTGTYIWPEVNVLLNGETLERNVDYEVWCSNNTEVGEATAIIKGVNKYKGSIIRYFQIVPYCGVDGDNVIWSLSDDGTLTFSGTGAIADYTNGSPHFTPWRDKYNIKKVVFEDGITRIGDWLLYRLQGLEEVVIPDSVVSIGEGAFYLSSRLTKIDLPDSVTTIGERAFDSTGIESFTLPPKVTEIPDQLFYGGKLSTIRLHSGVTSIGNYAFNRCPLQSVTLPENITSISDNAFYNCKSLKTIYVVNDSYADNWVGDTYNKVYVYKLGEHYIYNESIIKEATCTEEGELEKDCSLCGDKVIESIPATGHQWHDEFTVDTEPTCTAEGSKSKHCANCNEVTDVTVVEALGHDWDAGKVTTLPSCTEEGVMTFTCSRCEETRTESMEAIGHSFSDEFTVDIEPTCTVEGSKSKHCANCDEKIEVTAIPANGHTFGEWVVTDPSTCEGFGVKQHSCDICGFTETEATDPTGHDVDEKFTVDVPATCTTDGSQSKHCRNCDAKFDSEVIPATGHTYGDWNIVKEATCTETGSRVRVCKDCNDKVTEEIPALGHKLTKVAAKEATTTAEGNIEYWTCSACGKYFSDAQGKIEITKDSTVIPKKAEPKPSEPTKEEKAIAAARETLNTAVADAKNIKQGNYSDESFKALQDAIAAAETLANSGTATAEQLKGAADKVTAAKAALKEKEEPKPDEPADPTEEEKAAAEKAVAEARESVNKAVEDAKSIEQGIYTAESYEALQDAIKAAEALANDPNVTAEQLKEAADKIKTAEEALAVGANPAEEYGEDGTAVGPGANAAAADQAIKSLPNDNDPEGAMFAPLMLKSTKQTNTSIKLTWKKVKGAKKYVIYGNKCGKSIKHKRLAKVTGSSKTIKKVAGKKLKKGTYYKFIVVALDSNDHVISTSKIIHVTTKGGKAGNHTKLTTKAKNNKVSLKKGKSFKLGAKATGKKVKNHVGIRYESSNKKIATVSKTGKIKGKKKGTCKIYVFAQNGLCKTIKVTVK